MDKILGRKQRPESKPPDCLSRYSCVKHSWRGRLKRVFCITPTSVHTQNPDRTLVLTNSYSFTEDSDIDSVSLGSDDYEFIISVRQDKRASVCSWVPQSCRIRRERANMRRWLPQSKFKPIKFTCKHRTMLLTDLFQCMWAAAAIGRCSVAMKVLG